MDMLPVDTPTSLTEAECLPLGTDEIAILASCAQTDGAIFAILVRMPPGGGPPLMHRHEPAEVYHVLSGELAFYLGRADGGVDRIAVRAGEVMPLAGGTPHTIRNETDEVAEAFAVHTPGAVMEGFTRAAAGLATHGSPSMDAVLALADEHGIEMLGPVPGQS
ncbi:cupin domain-containing protein [Nocardioides sp. SYSU D00038]|uniref:cupin domain-containing protein n=1 Tax=Nocardioides sp. SYSU D00038 TaxID=2812554 RepID=UPI0019674242|nr:cupin domain-containing protein [Nocardioides sp. SYSU D00038]